MPASPKTSRGVVLILSASLFFGICGPIAKALLSTGLTALQVTWLRVAGVCVVLMIAAIPAWRRSARPPLLPLIGYGLTAVAGVQAFYFIAVDRLPVGIALLLEFTGPILVVAWIRFVRRHRLPRAAVVGTLISLIGLAIVVQVWTGLRLDLVGLAAGAGAAACQAAYYLGGERLMNTVDIRVLLAAGFTVGAVAIAPLARVWELDWSALTRAGGFAGLDITGYLLVTALVASTALAYATGLPALRLLSAPVTGAMAYAEVVVAGITAWLALGEALTVAQIIGGGIVIAGVFTAQRAVATPSTGMEPAAEVAV